MLKLVNWKEVEHNYRFIDDISSATGITPSEEEYDLRLTTTTPNGGKLVFMGTELIWYDNHKGEPKFCTRMHFRDETHPIRIKIYPCGDSVISE